jgi:hypothetical protein
MKNSTRQAVAFLTAAAVTLGEVAETIDGRRRLGRLSDVDLGRLSSVKYRRERVGELASHASAVDGHDAKLIDDLATLATWLDGFRTGAGLNDLCDVVTNIYDASITICHGDAQ